jgi:hypothetical protein
LESIGIFESIEIYWNLLKSIGIYWNLLESIGIYWNLLESRLKSIRIYWNLLKSIGIYFGIYWNLLELILESIEIYWNLFWNLLDSERAKNLLKSTGSVVPEVPDSTGWMDRFGRSLRLPSQTAILASTRTQTADSSPMPPGNLT